MNEITIFKGKQEGRIGIQTPYCRQFTNDIKGANGAKWNGKMWFVDASELNYVIQIIGMSFASYHISGLVEIEKGIGQQPVLRAGFNEELDGERLAALIS